MRQRERTVRRVFTEIPFNGDVLEPPGANLDAILVAIFQQLAKARLKLARCTGQGTFGFELASCGSAFLVPEFRKTCRGKRGLRQWRRRHLRFNYSHVL